MKRVIPALSAGVLICTLLASCSKESNENDKRIDPPMLVSGTMSTNTSPGGSSAFYVTQTSSGEYISSYGGGIRFGQTLPHPTTADPTGIYDGEPLPTIQYVNWTLNSADANYTINGAYFDVLEPTFPAPMDWNTTMNNYYTALNNYWSDATGTASYPTPIGTATAGSSGIKEVRGMLIRDHNSPTGMSVCSDTYKPTTPPATGGTLLGYLQKGSYGITFYADNALTNGYVLRVSVTPSNTDATHYTVSSFNLTFTKLPDPDFPHVTGTIHLANGATLSIDDNIAAP